MITKNQASNLRAQAGSLRRKLKKERDRYSSVSEKYYRIEAILEMADELCNCLRAVEREFGSNEEV